LSLEVAGTHSQPLRWWYGKIVTAEAVVAWRFMKSEVSMVQQKWRNAAFIDVINVALGVFLFLSPWIFGFTSGMAKHTSWMAGAAIAIVGLFAIVEFFESEEWINLVLGLWVAVCAWILGFHAETTAMQVHLVIGLSVAALSAIELWGVHHTPSRSKSIRLIASGGVLNNSQRSPVGRASDAEPNAISP